MKKIAILSPAPIKGSGGLKRIFTYAEVLTKNNYECDVYVLDAGKITRKQIKEYYGVNDINLFSKIDYNKHYNLAIATMWTTAAQARDMNADKKGYLVQDFEALFNILGDGYLLAEESYMYGLEPFVYGRWLSNKLNQDFGNEPCYADFGTNLRIFKCDRPMRDRLTDEKKSICFILQPEKPRRCHIIGLNALKLVKHFKPEVEIKLLGCDGFIVEDLECENLGVLTSYQLNEVYNNSTIGFCISSSNPSCNAFDMMAAGLPCVELYRDNNLYDMPDQGVVLAHQSSLSLAAAMINLIEDTKQCIRMSEFGIKFMSERDASIEVSKFLEYVHKLLSNSSDFFILNEKMYKKPPYIEMSEVNNGLRKMYKNKDVLLHDDFIIDLLSKVNISQNMDNITKSKMKLLLSKIKWLMERSCE